MAEKQGSEQSPLTSSGDFMIAQPAALSPQYNITIITAKTKQTPTSSQSAIERREARVARVWASGEGLLRSRQRGH